MYLGIDLGTSGIKLVLVDEAHAVVSMAHAELTVSQPHPFWSEQDPAAWWQALLQAMAQLRARAPSALAQVKAIGLAGQMHGAVLLDSANKVLRPAVLWNDGRAQAQCQELETRAADSREITGNLAMPGFTAPKLLWLSQHEPACFANTRTVLLPKDWLRLELSGELVSDMSDASGTLWLDVKARRWSDAMLSACGLDQSYMPRLCEGSEASARLKPDLAQLWGMPNNVVIAGGAGDNAASAVGVGAVNAGQGFVSIGTSGVIFVVGQGYAAKPERAVHAFAHALPERWHTMSVMLSAAASLVWAARLLGFAHVEDLLQSAAALTPHQCERAPLFLPYLSGERTPHNDPQANASFFGLRSEHTREQVAYAVAEGLCFGLNDGRRQMQSSGGELQVVGGAVRSDFLVQLLASTLNCRLLRPSDASHAGALGAARLGMMACGMPLRQACAQASDEHAWEPERSRVQSLCARFELYEKKGRSALVREGA